VVNFKIQKVGFFILSLLLFSCSSNDDDPIGVDITGNSLQFPLNENNSWNYRTSITNQNTGLIFVNNDILSVSNVEIDNMIGDIVASDGSLGFMSQLFNNSTLTFDQERLVIDGSIPVPIEGLEDFSIDFDDIGLYDNSLGEREVFLTRRLGSSTGEINGNTITVSYVIQTLNDEAFDTFQFTLLDELPRFGNFFRSTITIGFGVALETMIDGQPAVVPIIPFGEAFTVENVYAANLGLVESRTNVSYTINDISQLGLDLPFPSEGANVNTVSIQELEEFDFN